MIRRLLILDTETTGLSHETDSVVEVAACLYDVERASPVISYSSIVHGQGNAAESVNGIPESLVEDPTVPTSARVWAFVARLVDHADAVVAHRADFDYGFVPKYLVELRAKPWVCSKFDIEWPKQREQGEHLTHLALAHGLGLVTAHRAMADVDTLVRLFQRVAEMGVNVQSMLAKAMRPRVKVVSLAPFEQKDVVKKSGFAWDPAARVWWRRMPEEDVSSLPFKARIESQAQGEGT
jgi:DNA polymerase-3 subunit epsilon